jgi:hypothetical protein
MLATTMNRDDGIFLWLWTGRNAQFLLRRRALSLPKLWCEREEYEQKARARGDKHLQRMSELAREAGVKSEAVQVMHATPYKAILEAAGEVWVRSHCRGFARKARR